MPPLYPMCLIFVRSPRPAYLPSLFWLSYGDYKERGRGVRSFVCPRRRPTSPPNVLATLTWRRWGGPLTPEKHPKLRFHITILDEMARKKVHLLKVVSFGAG